MQEVEKEVKVGVEIEMKDGGTVGGRGGEGESTGGGGSRG